MEVSRIMEQQLKITRERLDAAKYLFDGGFYKDSVSRAYYSIYHAAMTILTLEDIDAKRSSGVLRVFGLYMIQDADMGYYYASALKFAKEEQKKGDYDIFAETGEEEAETIICDAEKFLKRVEEMVEQIDEGDTDG